MRIWDINPGYLNRQSLLGEHRELHGIVSIIDNHKQGYARHPETLRWVGYRWALRQRHQLLAAEMALRGYTDRTPLLNAGNRGEWPMTYIDTPCAQFQILEEKYSVKAPGRIFLPRSAQQLWSQHKYSILARDIELYKGIGREVASAKPGQAFAGLAQTLTEQLRRQPSPGGLRNALQHMWGHVSGLPGAAQGEVNSWSPGRLLAEIQRLARQHEEPYLLQSTALGELGSWSPPAQS